MAYTIYNNDGTIFLRLPEGTINNLSTSLTLIGKNVNDYGEYVNNNLFKLMTNFASNPANSPVSPKIGQLWYNISTRSLLVYDGTNFSPIVSSGGSSGGGGGGGPRATVATTTISLVNGASTTADVIAAKGYALYGIQVSAGAWVTVYSSSAARTVDSSRLITTDPSPGSGVIAEAISTSATTTYFTPAVIGFNSEASPSSNAYLKIANNSGVTRTITVTLTYLPLEN